jgi:hypothetical protein
MRKRTATTRARCSALSAAPVLVFAATLSAARATGQGFSYSDFGPVADLNLRGSAAAVDDVLRLTSSEPANGSVAGSAWRRDKQSVAQW